MAIQGILSPLMMISGAGILQNTGLGPASSLASTLSAYNSLTSVSQFNSVVASATGALSTGVLNSLKTLAAGTFPALTNSIPTASASSLSTVAPGGVYPGGFSGLVSATASGLMGSGDLSKFAQIWQAVTGYNAQANQFITSNINTQLLAPTFGSTTGGMENLITGAFNNTTQAFQIFGQDLANIGSLIDMNNLTNLGDPFALVRQVINVGGIVPAVDAALRQIGLSTADVANIAGGYPVNLADTTKKQLYDLMTKITGDDLTQIKSLLRVSTDKIDTMADLLNPAKILPNSYQTLTMPTPQGLRGIYTSPTSVNTALEIYLLDPNAPVYINDLSIDRARIGAQDLVQASPI